LSLFNCLSPIVSNETFRLRKRSIFSFNDRWLLVVNCFVSCWKASFHFFSRQNPMLPQHGLNLPFTFNHLSSERK
jgi:hypothetical protein